MPRELALDPVLVRCGMLNHLELGVPGENLVMHAADPVASWPHLAVRHGEQMASERRTEGLEHLLRRVKRNAAHQQELTTQAASSSRATTAGDGNTRRDGQPGQLAALPAGSARRAIRRRRHSEALVGCSR